MILFLFIPPSTCIFYKGRDTEKKGMSKTRGHVKEEKQICCTTHCSCFCH